MIVWCLHGVRAPIAREDGPDFEGGLELVSVHATQAGALKAKQTARNGGVDVPTVLGQSIHVAYDSYVVREKEVRGSDFLSLEWTRPRHA